MELPISFARHRNPMNWFSVVIGVRSSENDLTALVRIGVG